MLGSAVAGGASTAAVPSALTGPVTSVGPTTATATGTVNPNGQATTWFVEYGTSTSYGTKTATVNAGSGTANAGVSASLTGLAPATTYHYRVVATNSSGTARGADGIFATSSAPVAVTGAATERLADVRGAQRNRRSKRARHDVVLRVRHQHGLWIEDGREERRLRLQHGQRLGAGLGTERGRVYHYRLVATSDAGTSRGADQSFSTRSVPTVVTEPASSIAPTSATLNGTVAANGQATTWYFEYGTSMSYGSKTAAKSAGSGTSTVKVSASLTRLRAATTYHFRLVATNASGTSVGGDRSFSTSLPPAVRTGSVQNAGPTTATFTGAVDPRGRATTWYFEYGTSTGYGSRTPRRSAGSGVVARSVSESVSGLVAGATYHYRLVATNDVGTSRGADGTFTTAGVTIATPARLVVYGRRVTLSGAVPTRRAGEVVALLAQRYGETSFTTIANVVTAADGTWRYLAKPAIRTSYVASWNHGSSPATTVGVRPAVSLRRRADGRLATRVVGGRSFAGRFVQLQRRSPSGRWVTVKRARLNARSAAIVRATLPQGASVIRIAMSVNQSGAGYLAGFSRKLVYRRS